ncbi:uncharacterized protein LOC144207729 [Stigmatopora nigra]
MLIDGNGKSHENLENQPIFPIADCFSNGAIHRPRGAVSLHGLLFTFTRQNGHKMRQMAPCLLFILILYGGYADPHNFYTKTAVVGQSVNLTCFPDNKTDFNIFYFWLRLSSGTFPQIFSDEKLDRMGSREHIIAKVQKSDTAVYYCFKWTQFSPAMTYLSGTLLLVKDSPDAKASVISVTGESPSFTSQCSVLPPLDKQSNGDDVHRVYWFQTSAKASHPSFIYNLRHQCRNVNGGPPMRKCAFVNSSDSHNYLCAVATCGEILLENAKKNAHADASRCVSQIWIIVALAAALALSFTLMAFLTYKLKTKQSCCCQACPQTQDETSNPRDEDALIYSAPTVSAKKRSKRNPTDGEFSTYADVKLRES